MPCKRAMITQVISAGPDQMVEDAMSIFNEYGVRGVPVVEEGKILGVFHYKNLLEDLLPSNVFEEHGTNLELRLDYLVGAAPEIAKDLKERMKTPLREVMQPAEELQFVTPDTPLWEAVRLLVKYDTPLAVVEEPHSDRLAGVITSQSIVKTLLEVAAEQQ